TPFRRASRCTSSTMRTGRRSPTAQSPSRRPSSGSRAGETRRRSDRPSAMSPEPYRSVFRAGLFDGQTVIVTGGGTGIGRCIAHELASLGATPVLVGRREDRLAATVAEISDAGGSVDHVAADIRKPEELEAAVATTIQRH